PTRHPKRLHQVRVYTHRLQNVSRRLGVNLEKQLRLCRRWPIQLEHSFDCIRLSSPSRCFCSTTFNFLLAPRTSPYLHSKSSFHQSSVWLTAVIDGLGCLKNS